MGLLNMTRRQNGGMKQLDGMLNCASTLADIDFTDGLFSLPMHLNGSLNYNIQVPGMCGACNPVSSDAKLRFSEVSTPNTARVLKCSIVPLAVHLIQQF